MNMPGGLDERVFKVKLSTEDADEAVPGENDIGSDTLPGVYLDTC